MKTLILTLILAVNFTFSQVFDWEWQNSKPTGNDLNAAFITPNGKIFAAGSGSQIIASANLGVDWSSHYVDEAGSEIWNAFFTTNSNGVVVGNNGLVARTTDAGNSWNKVNSNTTNQLRWVHFPSEMVGFAVGNSGTVIKTTDGGATWDSITPLPNIAIFSLYMVNNDTGFAGAASATLGRLFRTTNSGATWENISANVPFSGSPTVRSIYFIDSQNGYFCTSTYQIYKTTDGGNSWTLNAALGTGIFYDIKFLNLSTGFVVGQRGEIFRTTDHGTTWQMLTTGLSQFIYSIFIQSTVSSELMNNKIIAAGRYGAIITSTDFGNTWQPLHKSASFELLRSIEMVTPTIGYATGGLLTEGTGNGHIVKTTNGGLDWFAVTPVNNRAYSTAWTSPDTGYIGTVGPNGIYKTTNGGTSWTQLNPGVMIASGIWYDMKFWSRDSGIAVGSNGVGVRTTNGGATWTELNTGFTGSVIYKAEVRNGLIYLAGVSRKWSRSTDMGLTFIGFTVPGTSTDFYSISFPTPSIGYIAGNGGRLFKTTDGGLNFTQLQAPLSVTFYDIKALNENFIWAACNSGTIMYSTDGAQTWTLGKKQFSGNTILHDLSIQDGYIWFSGTGGTIIKGFLDPEIPVELTSFSTSVIGNTVLINWETATETNNSGFEIQRKQSGDDWNTLAFIQGRGTTLEPSTYSYIDDEPGAGSVSYRLKQIDYDGTFTFSNEIKLDINPTNFELFQNYPNPFNPETRISFSLPVKEFVTLSVYNVNGELVQKPIDNKELNAGSHSIIFDSKGLSSGVYLYRFYSNSFSAVKKMTLLK